MNKSKHSSEEPQDRLSDLPDSIIFEIFGLLPMREVVRTTILSKRWENLWTTTPYLDFNSYLQDSVTWRYHSSKFISRALILWKGFKILKFKFCSDHSVYNSIIDWVSFAKKNGIQELCLDLFILKNDQVYGVLQILHSCASLKVLSLKNYNFKDNGNVNVQWNQLKSLTIGGYSIDQHFIDKVISGSPQLEVFILDIWGSRGDLSIRSTSLKKLSIDRFADDSVWVSKLKIWAPNLETFNFVGVSYGEYSLINVPSLTHLTLGLKPLIKDRDFGETLGQIFPTIQHVENLTMSSYWCIKGLASIKEKCLLSPWLNLKILTITKTYVDFDDILDILQIFPKLETLVVLRQPYCYCLPLKSEKHANSIFHYERNLLKPLVLQLRTVELDCKEGACNCIIPFIEILLKCASKLQKMEIRAKRSEEPTVLPSMSLSLAALQQELLRMPRSSPTADCRVDCC